MFFSEALRRASGHLAGTLAVRSEETCGNPASREATAFVDSARRDSDALQSRRCGTAAAAALFVTIYFLQTPVEAFARSAEGKRLPPVFRAVYQPKGQNAAEVKRQLLDIFHDLLARDGDLSCSGERAPSLAWISCLLRGGRRPAYASLRILPTPKPHVIASALVTPFDERGDPLEGRELHSVSERLVADLEGAQGSRREVVYLLARQRGDGSVAYALLLHADWRKLEMCLFHLEDSGVFGRAVTKRAAATAFEEALRDGASRPFECGALKVAYLSAETESGHHDRYFPPRLFDVAVAPRGLLAPRLRQISVLPGSDRSQENKRRRFLEAVGDERELKRARRAATFLYVRQQPGTVSVAWAGFGAKLLAGAAREQLEELEHAWTQLRESGSFADALGELEQGGTGPASDAAALLASLAAFGHGLLESLREALDGRRRKTAEEAFRTAVQARKLSVLGGETFYQSICAEQALRKWKREQPDCLPCDLRDAWEENERCEPEERARVRTTSDVALWLEWTLRVAQKKTQLADRKKAAGSDRARCGGAAETVKAALALVKKHTDHAVDDRLFRATLTAVEPCKLAQWVARGDPEAADKIFAVYERILQS